MKKNLLATIIFFVLMFSRSTRLWHRRGTKNWHRTQIRKGSQCHSKKV